MFLIVFVFLVIGQTRSETTKTCDTNTFPNDFKFGAGTSAYQIEGGWNEDGKSRSWWDWFTHNYASVIGNQTGDIACDSYHRYKEDVEAMKAIGLDFYRFSLAWSRILPKGFSYEINQAGVDYYNSLLDELEAAGIEPMVTLFHWDTPMNLEHLGTYWSNSLIVEYFVAYADLAFSLFGSRVKLWATINEPIVVCNTLPAGLVGLFPETPLGTIEYLCGHNVILAHAKTYRLYEEKYRAAQNGRISITIDLNYNIPLTNSTKDQEAAERTNQFMYGWLAHPLVYGDYPQIVKDLIAENSAKQNFSKSRLPKFSCKEKLLIKGTYDLFMVNYYTAFEITAAAYVGSPSYNNDMQVNMTQPDHWLTTAVSKLKVHYKGMRYILKYIKETYNDPEIIITESGYSDATGILNDTKRIDFIKQTLYQVRLAMCEDEVNVTRYTYWSLLDNFQWNQAYNAKFGLIYVDFDNENRTRTLKESAYYYRNLIQTHNINTTSP